MANGIWEDRRENVREDRSRSSGGNPGRGPVISVPQPTTTRWPASRGISGVPPSAGAMPRQSPPSPPGRAEILAAYDDLRERTRTQGDTVALGPAYQETLTRHSALLKTGRGLPRPAGRLRFPAGRTRRYRAQGSRRLRGSPYTGATPPARGHDALRASDQAGG